MNAVRFPINYHVCAALISYIFPTIYRLIGMKTAHKFRPYPNKHHEAMLDLILETCRHLYDLALADRKNAYEVGGVSRRCESQAAMLAVEKRDSNFKGVFSKVFQDVLRSLDKSVKALEKNLDTLVQRSRLV